MDYDDLTEKLDVSDWIALNPFFIPKLAIKNDNIATVTYNFSKTFFRLEKVDALVPNSNETTPVLVLFYCGSGKQLAMK